MFASLIDKPMPKFYLTLVFALSVAINYNLPSLERSIPCSTTTKEGVVLPCYCRTVKEQVFSRLLLLVTHSTERILPKDANSEKMLPQVTMSHCQPHKTRRHQLKKRRSVWGKATVGPFCSFSDLDAATSFSHVPPLYTLDGTDVGQWDSQVRDKAFSVVQSALDGTPCPIHREPVLQKNATDRKWMRCEQCDRLFEGASQLEAHLRSQKHRRRLAKLAREAEQKTVSLDVNRTDTTSTARINVKCGDNT
ncbi:tRNA dimethylallyltransferase [Homalodisca vitripennis]|nr:tRNA dimethylallyltransferase [Homalodisca vitripennis]KAG8309021.1 tRNA dimethylallyltransferase [Homalodisca vitripennis]